MMVNSKEKFEACADYVERTLESDGLLSFDDFRGAVMIQKGIMREVMSDEDLSAMRVLFEREKNFAIVAKELMRDMCRLVASRRRFDSGIVWLNGLVWDGVPRVERFMHTHFGAEDSDYTRAVGRYMWSGLAGRMFEPGCQLDMVIAMQSRQGTKKSTGLALLAPDPDQFTDGLSLHVYDDNFKRLMRGKVIVEIAELAGLSKGDINVVKSNITRKADKWIEKYQTTETSYARRCMLFASTNDREFLPADETGHRRWLPVEITELNRALIVADRDQLWAEGAVIWRKSGIAYADAERLATGRHKRHEQTDVWETRIGEWLTTPTPATGIAPGEKPLALSEVLEGALKMRPDAMTKVHEKRAGGVMRQLGFAPRGVRINGKLANRWMREAPPPPLG
ncbi:MAG: VapE domain-containing protein [Steroidobacteraceae bacterium]